MQNNRIKTVVMTAALLVLPCAAALAQSSDTGSSITDATLAAILAHILLTLLGL